MVGLLSLGRKRPFDLVAQWVEAPPAEAALSGAGVGRLLLAVCVIAAIFAILDFSASERTEGMLQAQMGDAR